MNDLIEIRDLRVIRDERTICSVDEFRVARNERVMIQGSNGTGKTTLLRIMSGLERKFFGAFETSLKRTERIYVHQNPVLFRGTVLTNAMYGLSAHSIDNDEQTNLARTWLKKFAVEHLADKSAATLSGGERRRASLARAFAVQPSMLLLDEPLAELDDTGHACLMSAIEESRNTTFVIASPIAFEADSFRVFELAVA